MQMTAHAGCDTRCNVPNTYTMCIDQRGALFHLSLFSYRVIIFLKLNIGRVAFLAIIISNGTHVLLFSVMVLCSVCFNTLL